MSTKLFQVQAFIAQQSNNDLGQFIGLNFGPGLVLTDQGKILKVDTVPTSFTAKTTIFRPGIASENDHVATWSEVEAFIAANGGVCDVYVDDSLLPCIVPSTANTECFGETVFLGFNRVNGNVLTIADGGRIRNIGLINLLDVDGAPTAVKPLVFDIPNGGITMQNFANIRNTVGATVAMISVLATSQFFIESSSFLVNTLEPTIPVVDVAAATELDLIFGYSTTINAQVLSGNLVKGAGSSTLKLGHDATIIFTPQALFLGAVTESRSLAAEALQPSSGITASRPALPFTGQQYFDATLGVPIWWNGAAWVNSAGAPV